MAVTGVAQRPPEAARRSPRDAVARRLRPVWTTWRSSITVALLAVSAFRVATLLLAWLAARGSRSTGLLGAWNRYDATWWASIAQHGYGAIHNGLFSDGAFAPAYAAAMRAAMWLLHVGPLGAGLVVSSASLVCAAALLHRLIDEDHGRRAAAAGVALLLLWPTAVFLAAPYSEPFSLALVAAALLAARRERWVWAGLLAAAALLSKYVLGLVVVALVIDHVVRRRRRGLRPEPAALAAIVLPGAAALGGVMLFMAARFGSPLYFLSAEGQAWGHRLTTPVQLAVNVRHELAGMIAAGGVWSARTAILDTVAVAGLAALAVVALRRPRRHHAEVALLALVAVAFLCMSGVDSAGRYSLVVAPVFLVLGPVLARNLRRGALVLAASAMLMGLQLVTFATGGWAG